MLTTERSPSRELPGVIAVPTRRTPIRFITCTWMLLAIFYILSAIPETYVYIIWAGP